MWGLALADFGRDPCDSKSLRGNVFSKKNAKITHKISRSCNFRLSLLRNDYRSPEIHGQVVPLSQESQTRQA